MTTPKTPVDALAAQICRDVAELPDRNSPEDWPEAMLVTHEELRTIVLEASARALAAIPADTVKIPTGEDEAALMVLLGTDWLKQHAPHRLKASTREDREDAQRERMAAMFAGRTPRPASADFDLIAPNDVIEEPAQDAQDAWKRVREEVGTKGWTVGESCDYFGFFMHGWRAALRASSPAERVPSKLHTFLDAAAGEGLVLGGVDAADLYVELFPKTYAAIVTREST